MMQDTDELYMAIIAIYFYAVRYIFTCNVPVFVCKLFLNTQMGIFQFMRMYCFSLQGTFSLDMVVPVIP